MKRRIAVFANGWNNLGIAQALKGIQEVTYNLNVDIFLFLSFAAFGQPEARNQGEDNIFNLPDYKSFDGAIVFSNMLNSEKTPNHIAKLLVENKVPGVSIGIPLEGLSYVGIDNFKGMFEMVDHLVKEHHIKNPAFFAGAKEHPDSNERLEATKQALAMNGIKLKKENICYTNWEYLTHGTGWRTMGGQPYEYDSIEANMEVDYPANEQMKTFSDGDIQTNSLPYVTVQDVIEEGESLPDRSDEDGLMEIFFAAGTLLHSSELAFWGPDRLIAFQIHSVDQPVAFTDYRHAVYYASVPAWSLGLNPLDSVRSIGYYHNHGIKIRRNVNGNNEICIPFLFNGKPDPRKIYIIRNKKYVCSRIEMAVGENGIEEVKTGYFYEML